MAVKKITQAELAEAAGMAQPHISAYVTGRTKPSVDSLRAICKALGVSMESLAGEQAPAPMVFYQSKIPEAPPPSETRLALLRAILDADDARIERIAGVLAPILSSSFEKKKSSPTG